MEQIPPVKMNIYQSNNCRKDLTAIFRQSAESFREAKSEGQDSRAFLLHACYSDQSQPGRCDLESLSGLTEVFFKTVMGFQCIHVLESRATYPANIYLFKVINRNTRKRYGICSKLTKKTLERRQ